MTKETSTEKKENLTQEEVLTQEKQNELALWMVIRDLGINVDTKENHQIAQAKICLLMSLGSPLGFRYDFKNSRGPYCPTLSAYLRAHGKEIAEKDFEDRHLGPRATADIEKVNDLEWHKRLDFTYDSWYCLLATMVFVRVNAEYFHVDETRRSLIKTVVRLMPNYTEKQCDYAYNILRNAGFYVDGYVKRMPYTSYWQTSRQNRHANKA